MTGDWTRKVELQNKLIEHLFKDKRKKTTVRDNGWFGED